MEQQAPAPARGEDTALGLATGLCASARVSASRGGKLGALLGRCIAAVLALLLAPSRWLAARRARASWAAAHDILDDVLVAVRAAFPDVQPARGRGDCAERFDAGDGALRGEVAAWKGTPIAWCVVSHACGRHRGC